LNSGKGLGRELKKKCKSIMSEATTYSKKKKNRKNKGTDNLWIKMIPRGGVGGRMARMVLGKINKKEGNSEKRCEPLG